MTNTLATWFASTLGQVMPAELVVFIVSLFPILECRGGLIVAALLGVRLEVAVPICIVGNVLPVPFILLLLKKLLGWMKKTRLHKIADWIEKRGEKKSAGMKHGEFWGLLLFVTHPKKRAEELFHELRQENIIVRHFDRPRIDNYLRITIGTDEQMDTLLACLKKLTQNQ